MVARVNLATRLPAFRAFPAATAGCPLVAAGALPGTADALLVAAAAPPDQDNGTLFDVELPGFLLRHTHPLGQAVGSGVWFAQGGQAVLIAGDGKRFHIGTSGPAKADTLTLTPAPPEPSLFAGLPVSMPPASGPQLAPTLDLSGSTAIPPELRPLTVDGAGKALPVFAVARSGPVVLATVAGAPPLQPVLIVLNPARRQIETVAHLPATTTDHIHLAPGGASLLVEEVDAHAGPLGPRRTGRLLLVDVASGATLGQAQLPADSRTAQFLCLLPDGRALYATRTRLLALRLAASFPTLPVAVHEPDQAPVLPFFFADR